MNRTARNLLVGCAAAAVIGVTGAVPASAAPAPVPVAWHQADDDGGTAEDDNGDNGLWGLLGLVGLLGLAGLVRRGPKAGAMAGYPDAGRPSRRETAPHAEATTAGPPVNAYPPAEATPPANTYPPAEPRRNPPGV
ncbi:WGxxGxxG family protein [Amycolatopsis sp. NPDC051371]|uniref:WGxxGxxG family protein n=1 Tax=Amycolatopsis sp. NPDC051371 TaxID=3155800 RepID=UPI003442F67A